MRVTRNWAKVSSCLSLCLLYISRTKRVGGRLTHKEDAADEEQWRRPMRSKGGGGEAQKEEMEDLIGSMPVVLPQPDQGDEELESNVWSALPYELLDRVLACLSVPVLLQFRSVCKRWRALISSPSFSKLRLVAPYSGPHFLLFESERPENWGAYNPRLHKWYQFSIGDLAEQTLISLDSDGGLVCAVMRSSWYVGPTRLLLCNPVNKGVRELPMTWIGSQSPEWIPSLVVLVVDQQNNSFKVIAAGFNGCPHQPTCHCNITEVYDSETDRWETTGDLPWKGVDFLLPPHVVCGGHIYCIARTYGEELRMVAYDLERKVWNLISLDMPPLSGDQVLLFERRGFLVLVQYAGKVDGVPEIYTWQPGRVHPATKWKEIKTLLPKSRRKFEELFQFDDDMVWVGQEDHIFFVSHKWNRALLYDMSRMSWTITPTSQFMRHYHSDLKAIPFDFNLQMLSD